jgi:ArsR family transcriptional regulator
MTELVGADQSTVSKHLAILKEAGFVVMEKRGSMNFYSIRCQCLDQFFSCIELVLRQNLRAQQELVEI